MTGEQFRFHLAGHLAAAIALIQGGQLGAAKTILLIVRQCLDAPNVDNPPQFRKTLDDAIADPAAHVDDLVQLELMFVGDENTHLEQAGIRMGKG